MGFGLGKRGFSIIKRGKDETDIYRHKRDSVLILLFCLIFGFMFHSFSYFSINLVNKQCKNGKYKFLLSNCLLSMACFWKGFNRLNNIFNESITLMSIL